MNTHLPVFTKLMPSRASDGLMGPFCTKSGMRQTFLRRGQRSTPWPTIIMRCGQPAQVESVTSELAKDRGMLAVMRLLVNDLVEPFAFHPAWTALPEYEALNQVCACACTDETVKTHGLPLEVHESGPRRGLGQNKPPLLPRLPTHTWGGKERFPSPQPVRQRSRHPQ